jgi:hypothetical protein
MKLGALALGSCRLIIVIFFWSISPFICMEYPSLSHLINVGLKSTLLFSHQRGENKNIPSSNAIQFQLVLQHLVCCLIKGSEKKGSLETAL